MNRDVIERIRDRWQKLRLCGTAAPYWLTTAY
jgi:hypothetical protein